MNERGARLWQACRAAAWPAPCVACAAAPIGPTGFALPLCAACLRSLPRNDGATCGQCDAPASATAAIARAVGAANLCPRCARQPALPTRRTPYLYAGPMRQLLLAAKHDGWARAWRGVAELVFADAQAQQWLREADAIVFVPSHGGRLQERGYEPAGLLARALAGRARKPCWCGALRKQQKTPPQSRLPRSARFANVADAFVARPLVAGASLVLVDDIATTGATLAAAGRALLAAGARTVRGICAAVTPAA